MPDGIISRFKWLYAELPPLDGATIVLGSCTVEGKERAEI